MTAASLQRTLNIAANPLVVRGVRSRLRPMHAASWGLVTVAFTTFVFLIVYLTGVEREIASPADSARATLVPLIVIQGFILMLLGTGSVASGMARERMAHLLDYQRLTPMTPGAKIVGLMFGLPAREYFMFALTVPFVLYAAWAGELPWIKLAQFYLVFFTSVWTYHMTGLVAGMVVSRPWRASMQAQGLVVLLYLILPQLSLIGFSFVEFLTVRPTFYAMLLEELEQVRSVPQAAWDQFSIRRWQEFRFFEMSLHPIVCSLALQAFTLGSLFLVVHRKWRDESRHAFPKHVAIVFFACVEFFVVGSLWPHLTSQTMFDELLDRLSLHHQGAGSELVWVIFFVHLAIAGTLGGLLIHLVTPESFTVIKGWRRAKKRGWRRPHWASDAASGMPVTIAIVAILVVAYALLLAVAGGAGRLEGLTPAAWRLAAAPAYVAVVLLFVQLFREQASVQMSAVCGFILWAVPLFAFLILLASRDAVVGGMYAGLPSPPLGLYAALSLLLDDGGQGGGLGLVPGALRPHLQTLTALSVCGYGAGCVALAFRWRRHRRRLRAIGLGLDAPRRRP